jgi:Sec-independent protein translocase protein TatA
MLEKKTVEQIREWAEKLRELGRGIGEFFRGYKRGWQGLTIDEDQYSGLLNVKDSRERTRLSEHDVYGHSLMELAANHYDELKIWGEIAKEEDIYFIPLEGEQRKEAILMQRARAEVTMAGQPLTVQMPKVETKPPEEAKPEKKGILHR